MSETRKLDTEYELVTLTAVRPDERGWVLDQGGWSLWVERTPDNAAVAPRAGDTARFYGRGIGSPVRGVHIEGRGTLYYRTAAEEQKRHEEWVAQQKAEKIAAAEGSRHETAQRIAALPDALQRRIARFRDANPDFDWEFLPYELMCCEDANKIAVVLRHQVAVSGADPTDATVARETVNAFHERPWAEQVALVPDLHPGHSGNSFGMACRLALWLLTDEGNVVREHGALVPLVGCEEYGCHHEEPPHAD